MRLAGAALTAVALACAPAVAAPRPAVDWTRTVALQPSGGYAMGNPKAKVTLVEYVSMTCSHCREFEVEGTGPLIEKYVKTGKVRYEVRNYVRDAFDMGAARIARCNGAKGFFPLTRALLKDQAKWTATAAAAPRERLEAMQQLPAGQLVLEAAKVAGLQKWAAAHGVPVARSTQCLTNAREIDRLVEMTQAAMDQNPAFPGTPSFLLNGKLLDRTATWGALEPQLRAALGERG